MQPQRHRGTEVVRRVLRLISVSLCLCGCISWASWASAATPPPVIGVYVINEKPVEVIESLKPGQVTHVLYAFLRLCGPGALPADAQGCAGKADFDIAANPLHARFHAAFEQLKRRQPGVQVLASMGGWGGSDPFFHLAATPEGRAAFVKSSQAWLRAHPAIDGLDMDWEHPGSNGNCLGSPADGPHFVALLADLRAGLDALGTETGRRYALTAAINTTKVQMARMPMGPAARSLDLVFLMSYDYHGGWSPTAAHHTPLRDSAAGDDSLQSAVRNLVAAGVPARKLVAGVAMYARGFEGVKPDGSFSKPWPGADGAIAYRDLATLLGLKPRFDPKTQAWALVGGDRFVGYDDPRAVRAKVRFARQAGLAGVFAWELAQDNGEILRALQGLAVDDAALPLISR